MSISISDLISAAETIRTNNLPNSNTPELVGSTMKGILSLLQASNTSQYDVMKTVSPNGLYIVDKNGYVKCQVTGDGPSGFSNTSPDLNYDVTEIID